MTTNIKNKSDELINSIMNEAIKETIDEYNQVINELNDFIKEVDK